MWKTETLPLRGFIISPGNASSFKLNEELWNLRPTSKQLFAAEGLDLLASILFLLLHTPLFFLYFWLSWTFSRAEIWIGFDSCKRVAFKRGLGVRAAAPQAHSGNVVASVCLWGQMWGQLAWLRPTPRRQCLIWTLETTAAPLWLWCRNLLQLLPGKQSQPSSAGLIATETGSNSGRHVAASGIRCRSSRRSRNSPGNEACTSHLADMMAYWSLPMQMSWVM